MKVLSSLLVVTACLLVLPTAALATEYTVNSTADEPDLVVGTAGCLTAGAKCTLRAAIEEANFVATGDTIVFDGTVFEGLSPGDDITLGSSLPAIKAPLKIDGKANGVQCNTSAGSKDPARASSAPPPAPR